MVKSYDIPRFMVYTNCFFIQLRLIIARHFSRNAKPCFMDKVNKVNKVYNFHRETVEVNQTGRVLELNLRSSYNGSSNISIELNLK